jgi:hypothetical protein
MQYRLKSYTRWWLGSDRKTSKSQKVLIYINVPHDQPRFMPLFDREPFNNQKLGRESGTRTMWSECPKILTQMSISLTWSCSKLRLDVLPRHSNCSARISHFLSRIWDKKLVLRTTSRIMVLFMRHPCIHLLYISYYCPRSRHFSALFHDAYFPQGIYRQIHCQNHATSLTPYPKSQGTKEQQEYWMKKVPAFKCYTHMTYTSLGTNG